MQNIDAFAFCRGGEQRAGKFGLGDLSRLRAECVSERGEIAWELVGSVHESGHPVLQLTVTGTMQLMCQRCLTPFELSIQSTSTVMLAQSEAAADEIEAALEDEEIEVVVGSKTFDITALIEDEALLAIPLSPKHEVCPAEVKPDAQQSTAEKLDAFAIAKKESPFAGLKDQLMFGKAAGKTKN